MRLVIPTVALLLLAVASPPASAQDEAPPTRHINFDIGCSLSGARDVPLTTYFVARSGAKFDTLIEIRRSFYDEIVESAEEIQP